MPERAFTGTVARTANSLDPTSRTMLVEIEVPNASGASVSSSASVPEVERRKLGEWLACGAPE